jgi:hypothetical protein
MSEYLVLLYQDESRIGAFTDAERAALLEQHGAFQAKHGTAVKLGDALQHTPAARTVQVGDGRMAVTDGPFVETKEALGGLYLIEAADLDEALSIAADVPAPYGGVEVRPVMVLN